MRTLILARHAKSSWKYADLQDHDRPLNKRGRHDAPMMASILAECEPGIQTVYTSSAVRALRFAEQISAASGGELVDRESLYTFSGEQLLQSLASLSEQDQCVVVVGHNPAITEIANYLSGERIDNVPTAGIVSIAVEADSWVDIASASCALKFFDYPKNNR